MKPIITPTVGRQVWFWPSEEQVAEMQPAYDRTQPMAATVTFVWDDRRVNLAVLDQNAKPYSIIGMTLLQDGDSVATGESYAEWMPYQKAQAEKQVDEDTIMADFGKILAAGIAADTEQIARVCHQVNKAYCESQGDMSQPDWEQAPEWQKDSARMGVELHLSGNHGPQASHESWMKQKREEGWVLGDVKDPIAKTHPCMLPFDLLPPAQQAKDYIFRAIVLAMAPLPF